MDRQTRRRTLRFSTALSADEVISLQNSRVLAEATTKLDITATQVTMEYDFPASCFADIWPAICALPGAARIDTITRLRHAVLAFAEENERQHCLYPANWRIYVEDIYACYFEYHDGRTRNTHKHLWRRYQKRPRS